MSDAEMRPHDEWDELAAGYALHALEPAEELAFTRHLANCAMCAATLREHELVAAQLGSLAGDDDAAPAWAAIRTGIVGSTPAATGPASGSNVVALDERSRRRRSPRLLSAAAAVVVLAAAGVVTWRATNTSPTASDRAISRCEGTAGCSVVRLHSSDGASPGVVLVSDGHATMVPLAMKPPAADRTYVLWQLLRNGRPTAVGEFRQNKGEVTAGLVASYADTAAFAVSLEPAGALPTQPSQVLAVGNTPA